MNSTTPISDIYTPPSQAQLALALAICKSKPVNLDIKEYIIQTRSHIKKAKNLGRGIASENYFDSVAFWQQAYTKSEDAQSKLKDQIYDLEQRVESLLVKLKPESSDELVSESRKRKDTSDSGVPGSATKRAKTKAASTRPPAAGTGKGKLDDLIPDIKYTEAAIAPLMRQLYTLHQSLLKKPNYSRILLCSVDLCKSAESAIRAMVHETRELSGPKMGEALKQPEPDPIYILCSLESAHKLLCQGLNKISKSTEGKKHEGHLIYHLASLFKTLLDALEKRCRFRARSTSPRRAQKPKSKSKQFQAPVTITSNDEVSEGIVRLLATMMLSGCNTVGSPGSLLEGYLFVLLSRMGKVLSLFEFRDLLLRPDLRANEDKLPMPHGLMQFDTKELSMQAAQAEARHLIWLLERAMGVVYSFSMRTSCDIATGKGTSDGSGSLIRFAKKKLQSTLLKAMFRDDDPSFLESLQRPQLPAETLTNPAMNPEESAMEWFPRELWRLLGWDMLAEILSK